MRSFSFLLPALPLLLGGCLLIVDGDDDRFTDDRYEAVQADGVRTVLIDAEAGDLVVRGVAGLGEIRVDGTARSSQEHDLDDIDVHVSRAGDVVSIDADVPGGLGFAELDLTIELPTGLALRIDDTSGEIEVVRTGSVDLDDDSGDVLLREITGDVVLGDGSGEIEVYDVEGDVRVREDCSGNLVLDGVSGDVLIEEDGSGDIDVANVDGDLTVERDGSGRIRYRNIGGRVDLP
jgi:hypothetical protein